MDFSEWGNQTVTEFILLGFGDLPKLQIFLFLLFLVIYIATMSGNILIMALVVADQHLHTPMYFFLGNLTFLETCYTFTILPRVLTSLFTGDRTISVNSCVTQFYITASLVCTECYLLSMMVYDLYLTICKSLFYAAIMNSRLCLHLAAGSWMSGFLASTIVIILMSQLTFCSENEINSFFHDSFVVSCTELSGLKVVAFICSSAFSLVLFVLTLTSYVCIIKNILRIPSSTGKPMAFSTCSSHLTVITIYYGTLISVYMLTDTNAPRALYTVFSVFYTVLTALVNPLIYSLGHREVKDALRKAVSNIMGFSESRYSS